MINIGGSANTRGPGGTLHGFGAKEAGGRISGRVLLRLMRFVRPHWPQMCVAAVLMLASSAANLLVPYLTKIAIDENIGSGDTRGLLITVGMLAGALTALYATSAAQSYVLSWVGQRVLASLRGELFHHLQALSVAYHDSHIVGVTISRVINDVGVINELLSGGLITMFGDGLLLVGVIVAMLVMQAQLALLTFAVLPLMVLATILFGRRARVAFRETRKNVGALVGDLAEDIGGMRVIQAFAQEEATQERFDSTNRANRDAHVNAMSLSFVFLPAVDILSVAATCIVLWAGGVMVTRGTVTIGVVVAFLGYVSRFFGPIRDLSQLYTTLVCPEAVVYSLV